MSRLQNFHRFLATRERDTYDSLTIGQRTSLQIVFAHYTRDRRLRLSLASTLLCRHIGSFNDILIWEAGAIISEAIDNAQNFDLLIQEIQHEPVF